MYFDMRSFCADFVLKLHSFSVSISRLQKSPEFRFLFVLPKLEQLSCGKFFNLVSNVRLIVEISLLYRFCLALFSIRLLLFGTVYGPPGFCHSYSFQQWRGIHFGFRFDELSESFQKSPGCKHGFFVGCFRFPLGWFYDHFCFFGRFFLRINFLVNI